MNTGELASALGKSPIYVQMMKRSGFQMPEGLACVRDAEAWLKRVERWWTPYLAKKIFPPIREQEEYLKALEAKKKR